MNSYYRDFFRQTVLHMLRSLVPAVALAFAFLYSQNVAADADEPPLYVAPSGADTGDCLDAASPCQTLDFALQRVGKNGRIQVAAGDYTLSNPGDVFYLVSGAIDVRADRGATIVGVPHEFAGELGARGFRVIADTKGLNRETSSQLVGTREILQTNSFATACVGGSADGFPCDKVDLLAHIADRTPGAQGADIWGFLDLNTNREYAIMGYSTGTAVYDVTNGENPREVGFIDGQRTTWRDIKVYQFWNAADQRWNAYAYVTADNASDGLFIIDLTRLPHSVSRASYPSDFAEAHNVYLSKTEFSTGLALTEDTPVLVIAGSNLSDGRFRNYSLANPAAPSFIAAPATPPGQPSGNRLYMHDAASMTVTDSRKDTQCQNAATSSYCDVLFDFNESTLDIWDITDPASPVRLSQTPYGNSGYSHSGWWSEDKQYVFLQDELDERDRGLVTTLRAFSIADLRSPTLAGTWTGPTTAIDHNGFVRGNRYYMSNYARGLTILDISNPANPVTVGRFDSYPSSDSVGFPGAWGTYPFLPSGNVLISDIDSGLYVVEDQTRDVAEGTLSFAAASFAADESQAASIDIQRTGGTSGAVSVGWEIIGASGTVADVTVASGTLNWAAGDATNKNISLGLNNDGLAEGLERLMVRLTGPAGGATLSSPNIASVYVSDPGETSSFEFSTSDINVSERGFGLAVAVIQRNGSALGAASIDFAVTSGSATSGSDYTGSASGVLNWADGDADPKWIEYEITDDGSSEPDEFLELSLSNASGGMLGTRDTLRINILDGSGSNTAPNAVAGANQTVGSGASVTLNGGGSNDPDGDTLTYSWTQTLGPTVSLNNASSASASFTAPAVTSDTLLRFSLAVSDPNGLNDSAEVSVTVTATGAGSGGGGGGAISLWLLALLLLERMRLNDRLLAIRTR
ncbi:MAG: choice-of-anchor B family protein [Gammaproteobacteria bacterium]|nr:choice-of-anchor B family protein [Gammaproteobacteria bacterium]